jgi:hypothetical protein
MASFALPGSAAEDLLRRAPTAYNVMKSKLSTWNLNTPNIGQDYDGFTTSSASDAAMVLDIATEREGVNHAVDRDRWMATEHPGPFPL